MACKRIFIAINLPEEIKEELEKLKKEINSLYPAEWRRGLVKWVKKENLHITLLFIGAVELEKIPLIIKIAEEVARENKFSRLQIAKINYGPSAKIPPRLIWAELGKNTALDKAAQELREKTLEKGVFSKTDSKPFSAHITLGRIRAWQWRRINPEEQPMIDRYVNLSFLPSSIAVMESVLKRTGPQYSELAKVKL